jgi:hypothetical protein
MDTAPQLIERHSYSGITFKLGISPKSLFHTIITVGKHGWQRT